MKIIQRTLFKTLSGAISSKASAKVEFSIITTKYFPAKKHIFFAPQ